MDCPHGVWGVVVEDRAGPLGGLGPPRSLAQPAEPDSSVGTRRRSSGGGLKQGRAPRSSNGFISAVARARRKRLFSGGGGSCLAVIHERLATAIKPGNPVLFSVGDDSTRHRDVTYAWQRLWAAIGHFPAS